jgi:hypothetical protein
MRSLLTYFCYGCCCLAILKMKIFSNFLIGDNYSDFLKRHLHLRNKLLDQGYKQIRLIRSLKKFIFRYQDLVEIYSVSAEPTFVMDAVA